MKLDVVVHEAEEGGWWAHVPAIPGCATQGETLDELFANVRDAVAVCLASISDAGTDDCEFHILTDNKNR